MSHRSVFARSAHTESELAREPQHRCIGSEHVTDHGPQTTIAGYADEFRQQALTQTSPLPCIQHGNSEFAVIATGAQRVTTFTQLAGPIAP